MRLYEMDAYQKIDYLIASYFRECQMLDLLTSYIDEEELEKIVDEIIHDYRIPGFDKDKQCL